MVIIGGPETPGVRWGAVKASTAKESLKALKEVHLILVWTDSRAFC